MKGVEDKDFGVFRSLALLYAMYSKSKPSHSYRSSDAGWQHKLG